MNSINDDDDEGPDDVAPHNPIDQDNFGEFDMDDEILQSMKLCLMRDAANREAVMRVTILSMVQAPVYFSPSFFRNFPSLYNSRTIG